MITRFFAFLAVALVAGAACAPVEVREPHARPRLDLPLRNDRLAGWSFVLDPGHGGPERGAAAKIPGSSAEAELNLAVTLLLGGILEACGAEVAYTRTADVPSADTFLPLAEELRNRARVGADRDADFFLSIHHNASVGPKRNRVETYYKLFTQGPSRELAAAILDRFALLYPGHDTSLRLGNFAVLRNAPGEAVLVECTYLSDKELSLRLETLRLLRLEAEAIAAGILDYARRGNPRIWIDESGEGIDARARDRIGLARFEAEQDGAVTAWPVDGNRAGGFIPAPLSSPITLRAVNAAGRAAAFVVSPPSPGSPSDTRPLVVVLAPGPAPRSLPSLPGHRLSWLVAPQDVEESIRAIEAAGAACAVVVAPGREDRVTHYFRSAKGRGLAVAIARALGGIEAREEAHDLLAQTSMPCVIIRSERDPDAIAAAVAKALTGP